MNPVLNCAYCRDTFSPLDPALVVGGNSYHLRCLQDSARPPIKPKAPEPTICNQCKKPIENLWEVKCIYEKSYHRNCIAHVVYPTKPLTEGVKYDGDKPDLSLLPSAWLLEVGRVLTFGAKKYEANNWRKGIKQSRLVAAALRHLLAYNNGEDLDPETGLSHLAHASCCMAFAFELLQDKPELDDRFKRGKQL